MPGLTDLIAQREQLEKKIQELQSKQRGDAIGTIRQLMKEHGLTHADLLSSPSKSSETRKGVPVAPKFRDDETGQVWSGRGLQPKWLKAKLASGRSVSDFAIEAVADKSQS